MLELSKRTLGIAESVTLAIDAKAKKMASEGVDVVAFVAGEPDFDTPLFIRNAAKEAMDKGLTRYTPAAGTLDVRKAICDKLMRENGLAYTPADIVVSNGAKHSLFNVFQALLNPGDEVIIPAPYWVTYPELVRMADGTPIIVETQECDDFLLTMDALKAAITPKTKALVLNNPCNPTGAMFSKKMLEGIAELAVEKGFYVVSDEIYEKLYYSNEAPVSIAALGPQIKDQTIVVNGASKAYAMTGWRVGYSASRGDIAAAMASHQSHATSNPNSIAQYALAAALRGPTDELEYMVGEFHKRRDAMVQGINQIPGLSCRTPGGAFYVFPNVTALFGKQVKGKTIRNSMDVANALLEEVQVAVVPGVAFGADHYIRLSYATSMAKVEEGLKRIAQFVASIG